MYTRGVINAASNIRTGDNPSFSSADFYTMYPQFTNVGIPDEFMDMIIGMSNASVMEARWNEKWKMGLCLFIAHFCTLYLQTQADPDGGAAAVMAAGQTRGLTASKSVGPLSVSYDFGTALSDLSKWAGYNLTTYGVQFATMAKIVGIGGMYIW